MLIFAVIILWGLSTLLVLNSLKYKSLRWVCSLGYIVGAGALGRYLSETADSRYLSSFLLSISYYIAPYIFLMFSLSYSRQYSDKVTLLAAKYTIGLLIPPIITVLLFGFTDPSNKLHLFLLVWVFPYFVYGDYILIKSYLTEKIPVIKHQKLSTCGTVSVGATYAFVSCHLLPALNIYIDWKFDFFTIFVLLILFLVFANTYGILGVRVKLEKYNPFNCILTLNSGNLILNHTLKNEIYKISICAQNIKTFSEGRSRVDNNADIIIKSGRHVLDMIERVKKHMDDISIQESPNNIGTVIDRCIDMAKPYLEKKNINIFKKYHTDLNIVIDRDHVLETLSNILMNSIEAMQEKGSITIQVFRNRSYLVVTFKDTGKGIAEEDLPKVIEPFFTTKKHSKLNFGLGLSYCYNVMQKHGGLLEIQSKINTGTTVLLKFPAHRTKGMSSANPSHNVV